MKKFWNEHQVAIEILGTVVITFGGLMIMYYAGRKAGFEKGLIQGHENTIHWFEDHIPDLQVSFRLKQYFESQGIV